MTIRDDVLSALTDVAPETDVAGIGDDVPLRDQVDLDSMDWLRFLTGISNRLRVDIPESQYKSLRTLADIVRYAGQHSPQT